MRNSRFDKVSATAVGDFTSLVLAMQDNYASFSNDVAFIYKFGVVYFVPYFENK